jgi:hypothetical protein
MALRKTQAVVIGRGPALGSPAESGAVFGMLAAQSRRNKQFNRLADEFLALIAE